MDLFGRLLARVTRTGNRPPICRPLLDLDQASEEFRKWPIGCFRAYGDAAYPWPDNIPDYFPDVYVISYGHALGWIEAIGCNSETRVVTVGHIAITTELLGRGLGRTLATALRDELQRRYGLVALRFAERHSELDAAGYPPFFQSLGAKELVRNSDRDRRIWEWR